MLLYMSESGSLQYLQDASLASYGQGKVNRDTRRHKRTLSLVRSKYRLAGGMLS
jgi:hypothetical protein